MKAIQVTAPELAEVVDLPMPARKPGQALIKIMAVSICGTDVTTFRGTNVNVSPYPIIIGHGVRHGGLRF